MPSVQDKSAAQSDNPGAAALKLDPSMPGLIAANLGALGKDLGTHVTILSEGDAKMLVPAPPATQKEIQDAKLLGVRAEGMARARAAEDAGKVFAARYLQAGLMMAGPSNPGRREEQLGEIKAASGDELQDVLRINVARNVTLATRECDIRFGQYLKNNPQLVARIVDPPAGKTSEEARIAARLAFGYKEYDYQRKSSMKDGQFMQLPETEGRILSSMRRGYAAISDELRSRGLQPVLSLTGKGAEVREGRRDAVVKEANAEPAKVARPKRDGMSL